MAAVLAPVVVGKNVIPKTAEEAGAMVEEGKVDTENDDAFVPVIVKLPKLSGAVKLLKTV